MLVATCTQCGTPTADGYEFRTSLGTWLPLCPTCTLTLDSDHRTHTRPGCIRRRLPSRASAVITTGVLKR